LTNSFCPFNRVNSIMALLASNQLIGVRLKVTSC
jgi:hypothetical protein